MTLLAQDTAPQRRRRAGGFQLLVTLYRDDLHSLGLALIFYLIKTSPLWLMPLLVAQVITVITQPQHRSMREFFFYVLLIVGVILQNIPTHFLYFRLLSTATRRMEKKLRSDIMRRLHHLSMHFYYRSDIGALQSKLLRDVEIIEQLTKQLFEGIIQGAILIVVAVIVTAFSFPWFVIFYLLTVPAGLVLFHVLKQPLQQRNAAFRQEVETVSAKMNEMLRLIPLIRAHGIEQEEMERLDRKLEQVQNAGRRLDGHTAMSNASTWVTFRFFDALCLATAGYIAYTQVFPLSVGEVILLTGYFRNLTDAAVSLTSIIPQLSKGWESLYSIREILDEDDLEHNEGKRRVEEVNGHLVFEDVTFTYPGAAQPALHRITLDVQPGTTVAIIGHSGSGKTTLMNLIIGFLRPTTGRMLLDATDMNTLDLRSYRHFLGVVSQETLLFKGTIRENITFGVADTDPQRFQQVLVDANLQELMESLPMGAETLVGENGVRLSGGQRQRIAIARTLFRNPRVLILDEATSALDVESEALVKQALGRLMRGRTTFIAAHRLSTIRNADLIIVLDQGHIIETGAHEALLAQGGVYARLLAASGIQKLATQL